MSMFESMEQEIEKLGENHERVMKQFTFMIKDRSIPLDIRWKLFVEAPDYLSNHTRWIEHFEFEGGKEFEKSLYRDHQRGSFDAADVVEGGSESWDSATQTAIPADEKFVSDLKEHFLQKNLKSFEFDW